MIKAADAVRGEIKEGQAQSSGDTSSLATPVPIPNTEVKQRRADDTWTQPGPGKVGGRRNPALFVLLKKSSRIR